MRALSWTTTGGMERDRRVGKPGISADLVFGQKLRDQMSVKGDRPGSGESVGSKRWFFVFGTTPFSRGPTPIAMACVKLWRKRSVQKRLELRGSNTTMSGLKMLSLSPDSS